MKHLNGKWAWYSAVVLLMITVSLSLWSNQSVNKMTASQARALQIINSAERLMSDLKDAETGTRGYLLIKDETYLEPYNKALNSIDKELNELRQLIQDKVVLQYMNELQPIVVVKMDMLKENIDLQRKGEDKAAIDNIRSGKGKKAMDRIRSLILSISNWQTILLHQRTAQFKTNMHYLILTISFSALLLALVSALTVYTLRKRAELIIIASRDEAERANIAKDTFLATISHEIRTPLNGLLGMLELLGFTQLDSDQLELLRDALESGHSLVRIINDVLDHAKIEAGKLKIKPESVSISQLVNRVVDVYKSLASNKNISLKIEVDPKISPALLVDPIRLTQILGNLLSNAIKFTSKGYVEISAKLIEHGVGSETVRFSVRDTGIGIETKAQKHLFQLFEQASVNTTRLYGGTGLGLAISRRLSEMMGSTIEIESELGVGTTMSMTLIMPITEEISEVKLQVIRDISPLTMDKKPMVLAVDDHPINRKLLTLQLEKLGMRVQMAVDGQEALALWQSGAFSLVIIDCNMPVMDGYTFSRMVREIEARESRPHTPIIAWTANAGFGVKAQCRLSGMDDILTKPCELAILKDLLSKWLKVAETTTADPETSPIDLAGLDKIAANASDKKEILQDFMTQTTSDYTELLAALKKQDFQTIARIAHRIKGSSRMVGANELATASAAMENVARQNDREGLDAASVRLNQALQQLTAYKDKK